MTRILEAAKPGHSNRVHRYSRIRIRILLQVFASVVILLLSPSQALASDEDTLTYDEALGLALACDSGVLSARGALELANLRLIAAEASRLPSLTLKASPLEGGWKAPTPPFIEGGKYVSSGIGLGAVMPIGDGTVSFSMQGSYYGEESKNPAWNDSWKISISLPVLGKSSASTGSTGISGVSGAGGGSYRDQVRLAKTGVRNAEFELSRAIAKARSSLETAYHGVIRDTGKLEAARMNLARVKQHFTMVESRHIQGNASDLDLVDAEQGVRSAEIAVDAAYHALKISEMSLNRLIGRNLNEPLILEPVGEYTEDTLLSLDEYISLALCHRQEPVLAEENLANAEIELATARSGLLPQVALRGSLTDDGSWSVSIDLSKTLSKNYAAELSVKSAENAVAIARQNLAATKEAIVMEVTGAYYALLEAEAYLALAKHALEKAAITVGVRETQYKAGAATHQDVALAITALSEAETDLTNAQANCFLARSRLIDAGRTR